MSWLYCVMPRLSAIAASTVGRKAAVSFSEAEVSPPVRILRASSKDICVRASLKMPRAAGAAFWLARFTLSSNSSIFTHAREAQPLLHAAEFLRNQNPDNFIFKESVCGGRLWPHREHQSNRLKSPASALGFHGWHSLKSDDSAAFDLCRWCPEIRRHPTH
jgi:hypothetical protein